MNWVLLANCISFAGMGGLFFSTIVKKKRQVLLMQSFNHACAIAASTMLRGYSGAVQEAVNLTRNILLLFFGKFHAVFKVLFVVLAVGLGVLTNVAGEEFRAFELLPVAATAVYSVVLVREKSSAVTIKAATALCTMMWAVYSLFLQNFVYVASNVATSASAVLAIVREKKGTNDES
ncbi:MAG: YgjV family protein [Oscillospiraceae bacterium]|jgi:hypothetical protein|nr:YgjV family protein [Oscillospiraceae bacterium]